MEKTKVKTSKGITLIALVLTIIVLLILVGISIATLTGENGIITKATTAREEVKMKQIEEEAKLVKLEKQMEAEIKNEVLTKENLITALKEKFKGSTIEDERVVVENGLYDIVVSEDLQITVVKHEELTGEGAISTISYIAEDIDGSSKRVILSLIKQETNNELILELEKTIEEGIEEAEFDGELRVQIQEQAAEAGLSYGDMLLAIIAQRGLDSPFEPKDIEAIIVAGMPDIEVNDDLRAEIQKQATEAGMTYENCLIMIALDNGISIVGENTVENPEETVRLEKLYEKATDQSLDDATREQLKSTAESSELTYNELLILYIAAGRNKSIL